MRILPKEKEVNIKRDLERFIALLEQNAELVRVVDNVDWKYEIADRTREVSAHGKNHPALLFESIKDHPGHRILTNGLASYSKIALALGLDAETPFREIVSVFKDRITNPLEPLMTGEAPVKEVVHTESDVNLLRLPVPWWNREDAGRYIGTWHLNITKDPETGIRNIGIYRMQLLGERTAAVSVSLRSHLAIHHAKARSKGAPLEMAVAIGVDENIILAAAAAAPYGSDEFGLAGGLCLEPIELTKCRTVDLEIPASSEIVIEGRILPEMRVKEGPFLDYSGTANEDYNALVFEVSALMTRRFPVFRGAVIGSPGTEDYLLLSLLSSAGYLDFHGSRAKQKIQNILLSKKRFKSLQLISRVGHFIKGIRSSC